MYRNLRLIAVAHDSDKAIGVKATLTSAEEAARSRSDQVAA
jgi:hypothetical protein